MTIKNELLGSYFSVFRDFNEFDSVSIKEKQNPLDGGSSLRIMPVGKRLKNYFRIVWACNRLADRCRRLSVEDSIIVTVKFKNLEFSPDDLSWLAFMKSSQPNVYEHANSLKSQNRNLKTTQREFSFELSHLKEDEELYLMFHFNSLTEEAYVENIDISWLENNQFSVLEANLIDHRLSVSGWVKHPEYPGIPVRLELFVNNVVVDEYLARATSKTSGSGEVIPGSAYVFKLSKNLPYSDKIPKIAVSVENGKKKYPVVLDDQAEILEDDIATAPSLEGLNYSVIGKIEKTNVTQVIGWALCKEHPEIPMDLVLEINSMPFAHVKCSDFRQDVKDLYGGNGIAGFCFNLPPNIRLDSNQTITVRPAGGTSKLKGDKFVLGRNDPHFHPSRKGSGKKYISVQSPPQLDPVSAIVLNQNGRDLLVDMFESAEKFEDISKIEWIIIDHNSTDDSEDVAAAAKKSGHNVRFVKRNGNFSFSNSNNFGAAIASNDTLIFLNNDLIFLGPFIERTQALLSNPEIGAVGSALYDYIEQKDWAHRQPIQHLGVCINPDTHRNWIRPFEVRACNESFDDIGKVVEQPIVTGAFLAMKASTFQEIGQFDEAYIYGLEDVDLCMKVQTEIGKKVVSDNALKIAHHRGFSRKKEKNVVVRQRNNNNFFNRRWGNTIRMNAKKDVLVRPGYWLGSRPVIAFIVADAGDATTAGEYYTALELAKGLQKSFPCHLRFITKKDWYDLSGVDVLIVMVATFDINKVKTASPFLVTVNWTRQWFDRWASDETIQTYDFVLASSQRAADYLNERTSREVTVVPIASNFENFSSGSEKRKYHSDYCFTGNHVGTTREIQFQLDPDQINGVGAVYGSGWAGTSLERISRGPISYSDIADVYASTKIVIDDANIATKNWGSCNSRVFDSIAAGCLLITNGDKGVEELFGDLVPTFSDKQSLTDTINYWIEHEDERLERVKALREILVNQHTYDHRADVVGKLLTSGKINPRISIKCAAKFAERHNWGDFHFAESLARELRELGFTVRVDCRESWHSGLGNSDDAVIVLRGIIPYSPKVHQKNIMWLISHPSDITLTELEKYDHLYIASNVHADILKPITNVPTEVLLQCTDTDRFKIGSVSKKLKGTQNPLFVGNSRGVFRTAVKWSIENDADIDLFGNGWEQFVNDGRLKGNSIPNDVLSSYYESSRVVLCDHWEDMKRLGYLSNRAFDAMACGAWLAVDEVVGLEDILPGGYTTYNSSEEFDAILNTEDFEDKRGRTKRAKWVVENHSFKARAKTFASKLTEILT